MLRAVGTSLTRSLSSSCFAARQGGVVRRAAAGGGMARFFSSHKEESPEEFDQRFVDYFNREDIDGWMVRKAMTELQHHDVIPEPKIVASALRACRRVNDMALAVRFMEAIKIKCGSKKFQETIYPYIIQEVRSVLDELGISTPEELGYDKPELFHPDPDWWPKKFYEEYGYDKDPKYTINS